MAAVAGRHFLGSVLADVASEIGDQDERLDELEAFMDKEWKIKEIEINAWASSHRPGKTALL